MRLFAQRSTPGGIVVKFKWLRRTAIARILFDQAISAVAGTRRLARLREWACAETKHSDMNAMSEHLRALNELPFTQEARDLVAIVMLYRRLRRAMFYSDIAQAADIRPYLNHYPERARRQGRTLYMLTTGIIMKGLPPADLEFIAEAARGPDAVLPRAVIERWARPPVIWPVAGMVSAA